MIRKLKNYNKTRQMTSSKKELWESLVLHAASYSTSLEQITMSEKSNMYRMNQYIYGLIPDMREGTLLKLYNLLMTKYALLMKYMKRVLLQKKL